MMELLSCSREGRGGEAGRGEGGSKVASEVLSPALDLFSVLGKGFDKD
jgi:hypothetical protein